MERRPWGFALVFVIGVLGVLALLATCFVAVARLERRASQQRMHATRAFLLARSGIEDALARLATGQDPLSTPGRYLGEDWLGDGDQGPSSFDRAQETFGRGVLDLETCPPRHALRPSFFVLNTSGGVPDLRTVEGRARGRSGNLAGGTYAIRIVEHAGFHVNGGDLSSAGEHPGCYDPVLRRILGNLAEELGAPLSRTDGEALVARRPAGGWTSFDQILSVALAGERAKLERIRPFLLLHAWVDRKVIRPNLGPGMPGVLPRAWAEIRRGSSDDPAGSPAHFNNGRTSPMPVLEPRAPVSLPWARAHREALTALTRDLEGTWLDETLAGGEQGQASSRIANALGQLHAVRIGAGEARAVSVLLATGTSALSTWQEFNAWCDTLGSDVLTASGQAELQAKRDLLKANFNPNSDLNKFNPNPSLWKSVDKQDLLAYSTELSLHPDNGWELSCAGKVLSPSGDLLGARTLETRIPGPQAVRLTTQREFVCNDLGRLDEAGDERDLRLPGWQSAGTPEFITPSNSLDRTWGHRLDVRGKYPGSWMDADSGGLSLQTYPEPCFRDAPGGALGMSPADYDGSLQLATIETVDNALYSVTAATQDMMCLARFDDGFDLDLADGRSACQPDVRQGAASTPLLDGTNPGVLHPDGCYSERNRTPAFYDRGNSHGFHGALSFWMKPNYDILKTTSRGRPCLKRTNYGPGDSQFFFLGVAAQFNPKNRFSAQFEVWHPENDIVHEHTFQTPTRPILPHRWYLLSMYWDFQVWRNNDVGSLLVDHGTRAENRGTVNWYSQTNALADAQDITLDAPEDIWPGSPVGPHKLFLGHRGTSRSGSWDWEMGVFLGTGADATFDEFAIWDFGQDTNALATLARTRANEGRYYKGWRYGSLTTSLPGRDHAGAWFSAPVALPKGSVLKEVRWTWLRPADLTRDYVEIELTDPAGAAYLWATPLSRSTQAQSWNWDRQTWKLRQAPPSPFRIHAVFRRPFLVTVPILDSPVLDDLTLLYEPSGGPACVDWREEPQG